MLSREEMTQFVREGVLAKPGLLSAADCDRCVELGWKELEKLSVSRDPSSWRSNAYLRKRRGVVKLRQEIQDSAVLRQLTAENAAVHSVIRFLLREGYDSAGVRGLYPTFPVSRSISRPYEAHIEGHPVQVFVMFYLDDVTTQNGGLTAWPGSHRAMYPHFASKFDHKPRAEFHRQYDLYNPVAPLSLTGAKGDVFFLHHRMLHSGSNNFRDTVRWGVLVDYLPRDFEALRKQPPGVEMWEDWSDPVREVAREATDSLRLPRASPSRALRLKALHLYRGLRGQPRHDYVPEAEKKKRRPGVRADA